MIERKSNRGSVVYKITTRSSTKMAVESNKGRPSRHTVTTVSNARIYILEKIKNLAIALFTLCGVGFVFLFAPIVSYYFFGVKDMGQVFGDYFDEKAWSDRQI